MGSSVSVRGPLLGMEISGETEGRGAPKKALIAASISPLEDSRKNLALAGSTQPVTWQNWAILSSMAAGTWEGNTLASGFVFRGVTAQSEQLLSCQHFTFWRPRPPRCCGLRWVLLSRCWPGPPRSRPRPSRDRHLPASPRVDASHRASTTHSSRRPGGANKPRGDLGPADDGRPSG